MPSDSSSRSPVPFPSGTYSHGYTPTFDRTHSAYLHASHPVADCPGHLLVNTVRPRQTVNMAGLQRNTTFVPPDQVKGNKIVIMSQVCKQTVARSSTTLENAKFKDPPVSLLLHIPAVFCQVCEYREVSPQRLSTSGSTSCTFHVLTPNRPLVLSGNERLTFAPYHTHYPRLEEHMAAAGLQAKPNLWDNPLCMGPEQRPEFPIWDIMDPKDLYLFAIPFHMEGDTTVIVGGLPAVYQKALRDKERQIMLWQKTVKETGLTKEQRKCFQATVEATFQEWLARTGRKRELDALSYSASTSRRK
ncbi:TBCC domain-containing protein 1 [Lamellibrachia satsuma]|nr:TBCC domain-containing protein 1 [Lamellibrachia satsuma]